MENPTNAPQRVKRFAARSDRDPWSEGEVATLRQLVRLELPMRFIARKLDRPEQMVRQKAHRMVMAEIAPAQRGTLSW